jgi:tight adherence protein C
VSPLGVIAAAASAAAAASVLWLLVPPSPRLGKRVRPYVSPGAPKVRGDDTTVRAVFGPMVERLVSRAGRLLAPGADQELAVRLRQAGIGPEGTDADRVASFRVGQIRSVAVAAIGGAVLASLVGLPSAGVVGVTLAGGVSGWGRTRGRLERLIEERRQRMRIEIYTIDQILALRVRAGGGVVHAVSRLAERGRGEVVAELNEALRLHRSGMSAAAAFARVADLSPEPACARTYRLLAVADERGVDLAAGLVTLAEDVRETRREALKRAATRRRAAMLVPTIALLAPTLLLFVAAPLPFLLTGWR